MLFMRWCEGVKGNVQEKQIQASVPLMWYSIFHLVVQLRRRPLACLLTLVLVTATAGMQTLTQQSAKQKVFC